MSADMEQFGEFGRLAPLIIIEAAIRKTGLDIGLARLTWLLPVDVLPGVSQAYGYPIERVEGIEPALLLRPVGHNP